MSLLKTILNKIKDLNGKVLYENADGSNKNITLSDSVANYKFIKVFYRDSANYTGSVEIENPNSKLFDIRTTWLNATETYSQFLIRDTLYKASNTSLTIDRSGLLTINVMGQRTVLDMSTNYIYITKVIGYK